MKPVGSCNVFLFWLKSAILLYIKLLIECLHRHRQTRTTNLRLDRFDSEKLAHKN